MESMDNLTLFVRRLLKAKEERRRMLANLSYPEKVRIVVQMQKMTYPIVRHRNPRACIWVMDNNREN